MKMNDTLYDDNLYHIFSFLDQYSISKARQVCTLWNTIGTQVYKPQIIDPKEVKRSWKRKYTDGYYWNPLNVATRECRYLDILNYLASGGQLSDDATDLAGKSGHICLIELYLLRSRSSIMEIFMGASERGDKTLIDYLINEKKEYWFNKHWELSGMWYVGLCGACAGGHTEIAEFFFGKISTAPQSSEHHTTNSDLKHLLYLGCRENHPDICKLILSKRIYPERRRCKGKCLCRRVYKEMKKCIPESENE